uniref:receptor protein-tyrosine kinase n=1 Tax=Maylandia zebra TaxID=106582 RepID=A0A3P9BPA5_9CICH
QKSLLSLIFKIKPERLTVCDGTKNFLSTMGNSEIMYNLMKTRYNNCDIVIGNLEITMMGHTRDFNFLESIKEVTGYILFAINEFSRLPLHHLRIIRGSTLYEDQYALAVMVNYQRDGEHGLQELGLTHLTEILRGGVKIIRNKYLSYAPQVNWLDISCSFTLHIVNNIRNFKVKSLICIYSTVLVSRQVFTSVDSLTVTKTVCAPQCSGRCFGRNPSECCHVECAGGCTGPKDTDCFACRNFNNSGSCVPQCPQTVIYNRLTYRMEPNPNAKYQYGSICVTQCPKNVVVDGSSCVSNCPSNKMEVEKNGVKTCEPCKGLCPKGISCRSNSSSLYRYLTALLLLTVSFSSFDFFPVSGARPWRAVRPPGWMTQYEGYTLPQLLHWSNSRLEKDTPR